MPKSKLLEKSESELGSNVVDTPSSGVMIGIAALVAVGGAAYAWYEGYLG